MRFLNTSCNSYERAWTVYVHTVPKELSGYDYDKHYVGITSMNPQNRWNGGCGYSGQVFYNAIQKYGWKNINHEIYADCLSEEDAKETEIMLIKKLKSHISQQGYNVSTGGDGTPGICSKRIDLVGKRFGKLTVISISENDYYYKNHNKMLRWVCECDCGNIVEVTGANLRNGYTKSCGCQLINQYYKRNEICDTGEYIIMKINAGEVLLDYEDYEWAKNHTWNKESGKSIKIISKTICGDGTIVYSLRNHIVGLVTYHESKPIFEYKNGNKFDLRKSNFSLKIPDFVVDKDDYIKYLESNTDGISVSNWRRGYLVSFFIGEKHSRKKFKTFNEAYEFQQKIKKDGDNMGDIKLAHATHDENNRWSNGKAGDQTGQEVYIREWYNRPWSHIIRFKDPAIAEKVAVAMEHACKNNNIGYDQYQRNTLLKYAREATPKYDPGKVTKKCETDCSALVSLACMYAGIPEKVLFKDGNSSVTSNIRSRLMSTGKVNVYTDKKYLKNGYYLKRGDILLYEGHHVAVAIENGRNVKTSTTTTTKKATTTTTAKQSATKQGIITVALANVRLGAGTNNALCKSAELKNGLKKDTKVEIIGQEKASNGKVWYIIKYKGKQGYVSSACMKPV